GSQCICNGTETVLARGIVDASLRQHRAEFLTQNGQKAFPVLGRRPVAPMSNKESNALKCSDDMLPCCFCFLLCGILKRGNRLVAVTDDYEAVGNGVDLPSHRFPPKCVLYCLSNMRCPNSLGFKTPFRRHSTFSDLLRMHCPRFIRGDFFGPYPFYKCAVTVYERGIVDAGLRQHLAEFPTKSGEKARRVLERRVAPMSNNEFNALKCSDDMLACCFCFLLR